VPTTRPRTTGSDLEDALKWFHKVPDGVWILALLIDAAAAVYVGHALMLASGH
jgi:hypothetical protein